MIRGALAALILALASAAIAQPAQPLRSGEALTGRFVEERHLAGLAAPLRSEGSFVLAVGKGLIWRGEKPFAIVTVITGAGIVQTVEGKEVQRLPATRLPFLDRFYQMLSGALAGDWTALEQDFSVERQDAQRPWKIVLRPLHKDDPVATQLQSITVSGDTLAEAVEIRRANGDWEELAFHDQALSASPLAPEDARLLASGP
jgi:hypothetical protein